MAHTEVCSIAVGVVPFLDCWESCSWIVVRTRSKLSKVSPCPMELRWDGAVSWSVGWTVDD